MMLAIDLMLVETAFLLMFMMLFMGLMLVKSLPSDAHDALHWPVVGQKPPF